MRKQSHPLFVGGNLLIRALATTSFYLNNRWIYGMGVQSIM